MGLLEKAKRYRWEKEMEQRNAEVHRINETARKKWLGHLVALLSESSKVIGQMYLTDEDVRQYVYPYVDEILFKMAMTVEHQDELIKEAAPAMRVALRRKVDEDRKKYSQTAP